MKIRNDFVTNSSSSSYIVTYKLINNKGVDLKYKCRESVDGDGWMEIFQIRGDRENLYSLFLPFIPYGNEEIYNQKSIESLIVYLSKKITYDGAVRPLDTQDFRECVNDYYELEEDEIFDYKNLDDEDFKDLIKFYMSEWGVSLHCNDYFKEANGWKQYKIPAYKLDSYTRESLIGRCKKNRIELKDIDKIVFFRGEKGRGDTATWIDYKDDEQLLTYYSKYKENARLKDLMINNCINYLESKDTVKVRDNDSMEYKEYRWNTNYFPISENNVVSMFERGFLMVAIGELVVFDLKTNKETVINQVAAVL